MTTYVLTPETAKAMCDTWFSHPTPWTNDEIESVFSPYTVKNYWVNNDGGPANTNSTVTLNELTHCPTDYVNLILNPCDPCHREILGCTEIIEHIVDVATGPANQQAPVDDRAQLRVIIQSNKCCC